MELLPYKVKRGFVLAVSAPSGTGKTSLCDKLAVELPYVARSVSSTTRPQREGEVSGKDYEFLTTEEFRKREDKGYFLETAEVFGNLYGTPLKPVQKAVADGKIIVMDIDTAGAFRIRKLMPEDSVLLFILPPSLSELETRLKARGKNSSDELNRRLAEASREIRDSKDYDYVIKNDSFELAYDELKAVIMAERAKMSRLAPLYK